MKRNRPTYRTKCKECESKDRSEFAKNNRKIINEQKKRTYNKNPDIHRKKRTRSHWKQKGYDANEISEYCDGHDDKCDICGKTALESKHGNKNLSIDHDHETKKIRGMICSPCNVALGLIDDDAEIALKMAKYLILNKNGGGVQIYPKKLTANRPSALKYASWVS